MSSSPAAVVREEKGRGAEFSLDKENKKTV